MKELSDNTQVSDRCYYFLLDWNDENGKEYLTGTFDKFKLFDLNKDEYQKLFKHATQFDLGKMKTNL